MTKVRRLFLTLLLAFAVLAVGRAQSPAAIISEHYTTAEGLPSNNVLCALKDRDGFMWFGTWYGLCRFDGSKFQSYNRPLKAHSANPPRKVETIVEDAHGLLWLKTVDWKLYVFNRQTESFQTVYDELKPYTRNLQVIKIQRTDDGHVLLLTKDKTLLLAKSTEKGLHISRLYDARSQIDPETFQLYRDVVAKAQGYTIYIGRDYRLFLLPKNVKKSLTQAMADEEAAQQRLTGRMQQMTAQAGIEKYANLYLDNDSLLWVSTPAEGIYCVSSPPHSFRLLALPDNDQTGVRCIYQLRDGRILVSTRSRNVYLYDLKGQLLQTLSYSQYGIGAVYHAMEDHQGRLWLSTKGDGLVVVPSSALQTPDLAPQSFHHYRHEADNAQSLSGNNVYMTYCDSHRHIWVCTLDGGLNLVQESADGGLTFIHKQNGFKHYPTYGLYTETRNIVEDQNGRLWIGTIDGLMSLDSQLKQPGQTHFQTYRDQSEATFANNDIYTLYRDQQGQIWVGAFGGGLQRLVVPEKDGGSAAASEKDNTNIAFQPLGLREGLRNDVIYSITEDMHGRLWFATEAGLSYYNQQTGRIRNFDRYDGIPAVQMEEASALCCTDGQLWVGCKEGVLTFTPDKLQTNHHDYRTFIIELVADNKPYVGDVALPYTQEVELTHDHNAFTIEFTALNYQDHGSMNYRYRLEGFDRDWRYSGPHRVGSYNEVPPGRYTFVVETIDDANPALQSSARLVVRVLPPWWQTWWAYLIYTALALLIAWLVIRTVLQMNRMRNEIYISQRLAKLTAKPDNGDEFIDNVHRVIRQNISNTEFNIDTIAQEMGMSRSAFYKKVKHQTGFAPVDLIKEFRLSYAAELLQTTTNSITEVAWKSGFRDVSYFGKCFRKRYGLSPREYINQKE